jgi:hypothetical protein
MAFSPAGSLPRATSAWCCWAVLRACSALIAVALPSSLSDLTANPLILLKWYYFLEAKLLSLFKGLKISMMPSPTGC